VAEAFVRIDDLRAVEPLINVLNLFTKLSCPGTNDCGSMAGDMKHLKMLNILSKS